MNNFAVVFLQRIKRNLAVFALLSAALIVSNSVDVYYGSNHESPGYRSANYLSGDALYLTVSKSPFQSGHLQKLNKKLVKTRQKLSSPEIAETEPNKKTSERNTDCEIKVEYEVPGVRSKIYIINQTFLI